jgi:ribosomal protein S12 methylthiotransferase accessory factor
MHRWVPAQSLTREEEVWIPASIVYIPYDASDPEVPLVDSVSTGLACARDPWAAIHAGICECLERDAVMICWLSRLHAPLVDMTSDAAFQQVYEERFAGTGAEYLLFDFTLDIEVPVYFGVAIDRKHEGLALAAGAAAHRSPRAAACKALVEAAQGRVWLKFMRGVDAGWRYSGDPYSIRSFEDHVRLFGRQDMLAAFDFLLDGSPAATPLRKLYEDESFTVGDATSALVAELDRHGLEVLVVDVTAPDVAECGFYVTKVVVPGLQQLNADHRFRVLGGPRLRTAGVAAGYRREPLEDSEVNPVPHPFP